MPSSWVLSLSFEFFLEFWRKWLEFWPLIKFLKAVLLSFVGPLRLSICNSSKYTINFLEFWVFFLDFWVFSLSFEFFPWVLIFFPWAFSWWPKIKPGLRASEWCNVSLKSPSSQGSFCMERKCTISSQMRGEIELVNRPDNRSPASGLYRESPEATSSTGGGAIKDASQISLTSSRQSGNEKSKQIDTQVNQKKSRGVC